jgi:hypothetical protein
VCSGCAIASTSRWRRSAGRTPGSARSSEYDHRSHQVRGVLNRVLAFIEDLHLAEVTNSDIEVLELCYEGRDEDDDGEPETEE